MLGNGGHRHLAEGDAAVFFVLGLQSAGEVLVALVGHDESLLTDSSKTRMPFLIHRQAQAAADLLPLLHGAAGFVQRANLEDVRVVPALAKGRMAEDEPQRLLHRKQPLLVLHDQVVDLVVGLGVAAGVLEHALLVLGEVAVVQPVHRQLEPVQRCVALVLGELGQGRLEGLGELAFHRLPGAVVVAVVGHAVDEEQAQDLDASPRSCSSFSRCFLTVCLICARQTSSRMPPISSPRRKMRPLLKRMILVARFGVDLGD